jgi:hypothetical protein
MQAMGCRDESKGQTGSAAGTSHQMIETGV